MEQEAVRKMKEGDFEGARKIILDIEDCIRAEPSLYSRKSLLEKVARLKDIYNAHDVLEAPTIPFRNYTSFKKQENGLDGIKSKRYIKDVNDGVVSIEDCIEVVIENCCNTVFSHFRCDKSVVLNNIKNCKVSCSGHQIRVNGCQDVELEVHTSTGVFLQNSKGIVVKKYGAEKNNKFEDVYDFSSPFESRNYTIFSNQE
ncbi:hypothetical protein EHEL_081770 [Encephalitozoon hellem ATCC 50504]|uniref:Tubulin binding cofactor C n=1 Tax=Encephalitozoon hellem TaxID=27973 RepID=A0A9Q9C791_ENCHE|nr:uncharacterized protein EHEL_081770 [Encephalitozoon hellem ATCC 50504]AFM98877.1 hypothetical protein EHEL_081770 [Encephalitozoon hellem ATCC 50504]UTX43857.1 tubulin binding cofactor C [Encephalitozoon hellem]|eukprot:XP_003887858.1 hypothetical protein EHEL_081770 [Encephalitozoon hellem ATCC 50504]